MISSTGENGASTLWTVSITSFCASTCKKADHVTNRASGPPRFKPKDLLVIENSKALSLSKSTPCLAYALGFTGTEGLPPVRHDVQGDDEAGKSDEEPDQDSWMQKQPLRSQVICSDREGMKLNETHLNIANSLDPLVRSFKQSGLFSTTAQKGQRYDMLIPRLSLDYAKASHRSNMAVAWRTSATSQGEKYDETPRWSTCYGVDRGR